jgi:pyrroline-5-carboxylate reductase
LPPISNISTRSTPGRRTHGVDGGKARDYIAALYPALGNAPDTQPNASFTHLAQNYATRGGINEQVLREMTERGVFDAFGESLEGAYRQLMSHEP